MHRKEQCVALHKRLRGHENKPTSAAASVEEIDIDVILMYALQKRNYIIR